MIRRKSSSRPRASPSPSSSSTIPRRPESSTFIIEVDRLPRELQTENNRIERVVNVRKEKLRVLVVDSEPRYEFRYLKNYLERDETIDLNVVLLSSDPNYSDEDRSAIPTFPAAKDDLFKYDVVIFGDADVSYLSQSQLENLVEFVTEKGGGASFHRRRSFQPARLPRHAARAAAAHRVVGCEKPDRGWNDGDGVPPRADPGRTGKPDLPVRRRRCLEHGDLERLAQAVLVLRGTTEEARRSGAGRA